MEIITKLFLLFCIYFIDESTISLNKIEFSDNLQTNDYGILTIEQLEKNKKIADIDSRWYCFPTKNVTFEYEIKKRNKSEIRSPDLIYYCHFRFLTKLNNKLIDANDPQFMGYSKDHSVSFCKCLQKKWDQIKKQPHVCLQGCAYDDKIHYDWTSLQTKTDFFQVYNYCDD